MKPVRKPVLVCLVMLILSVMVSGSFADFYIRTEGSVETADRGLCVKCSTTDLLRPGTSIDLYSTVVGDDNGLSEYVIGYTVFVNKQFYNYYPGKSFSCHIPFQVWHSIPGNGNEVKVAVSIDIIDGSAEFTYVLRVDQSEVNPLCAEHVFILDPTDVENPVYTCCEGNPDKHYLSSCIGHYFCTLCGTETPRTRCWFDENNTPRTLEHDLDSQGRCRADGCDYQVTAAQNLRIELQDDGKWIPGNEYTATLKWFPATLEIPDLEWNTSYESFYNDENQDVVTLLHADGNTCTFRANHSGFVHISVTSTYQSFENWISAEVAESFSDEEAYYQLLRNAGDEIFSAEVEDALRAELISVFGEDRGEQVDEIVDCVRNADPLYQELYLWSFFDYAKVADPETANSFHSEGRIQVDRYSADNWFHESGHAVDWSLDQKDVSSSDAYKQDLFLSVYNEVGAVVMKEVLTAGRDSGLTQQEKLEVAEYIMGEEYDITFVYDINFKTDPWIKKVPQMQMTGENEEGRAYSSEQINLYEKVVSSINNRIIEINPLNVNNTNKGDLASFMMTDAFAGSTNENTGFGHGPLTHERKEGADRDSYTEYYWYDEDGNPTYMLNSEMWAEYFSSRMTGHNLEINREYFSSACKVLDQMAEEMLERYKEAHN